MANKDGQTLIVQHEPLDETTNTSIVLGRNVTRLRKKAKITKQKFAWMVEIGRPFLNRIENGTADPRLSVILKLAEALDSTPQELLSDPDAPAKAPEARTRHARLR